VQDINPHFKEGEDSDFNDIPSVAAHIARLQLSGETNFEKGKGILSSYHVTNE
jgi:hypothetical protein